MKQSKIKRLMSKKLARELTGARGEQRKRLEAFAEREAADAIAKMREKGYELVTRLDTGEGVFARDDHVVGLHIQLSRELYQRLDEACRDRGTSKRQLVSAALEEYLERIQNTEFRSQKP